MDVVITYNIKVDFFDKNPEIKDEMKGLGYLDRFLAENSEKELIVYYLPDTTLWKKDTTPLQAQNDLLIIAKSFKTKVERLFAYEFTANWKAIPGEPYADRRIY